MVSDREDELSRLKSLFSSSIKVLKSATKPRKSEFFLLLRICVLGIVIIGVLGFIIRLISSVIGLIG
ncbi:MAG: protein translocase SEC61 complex subunit gamma [Candidatus Bathyarchaeota archaeon]|nr:protein translocase SEC61 complex subunit gamma [Candidatus Bathyarchaeota archaeon]